MYIGTITCECGQQFYCESINDVVTCPRCGKVYKLTEIKEMPADLPEDLQ